MVYHIHEILKANDCQTELPSGKYVPARPTNFKYENIVKRFKDAFLVLKGKGDVVVWEEQ